MRPVLRPGVRILRRDVHTLQAGLDWPGRTTLPDSTALRVVLGLLDGVRTCDELIDLAAAQVNRAEAENSLARLVESGLVVDQAQTVMPVDGPSSSEWAALSLLCSPVSATAGAATRRRRLRVAVRGHGHVAEAVRRSLDASQLTVVGTRADLVIIAADHEPRRELSDSAIRADRPHVWAYVRETCGVLGPFVLPGSTACLRCIDRAKTQLDRIWSTLVESATRPSRSTSPCDPALAGLVGAWAAHEVALWAAGLTPLTLGSTLEVPQTADAPVRRRYEANPECGCSWPPGQATMGA